MATQFYSALHYLNTHHDFVPVNDSRPVSDPQGSRLPWELLTEIVTPDTPEAFAGLTIILLSDSSGEERIGERLDFEDQGD
jgi:hypothetical protein